MQLSDANGRAPRRGARGGRARASSVVAVLATAVSGTAGLAAQAADAAGTPQDSGKAAATAPPRYARLEVDQQPLRCFASEHSPVYLDQLARGDVVQVGGEENGFVAITVPLGVTGYVHKKFATPPDDQGFVRTNGKRVSFRYRPRSTEAPADSLEDGAALHFMADDNDWYAVRNPRAVAYVPRNALVLDLDAVAASEGWGKLEAARREQWQKVTRERVEAAERASKVKQLRAELQELVSGFQAEVKKPWGQQQRATYATIEAAAEKLGAGFDAGSAEQLTATSLAKEIRKQVLVLDAQVVAAETLPPPKLDVTVRKPAVEDPLARFDLVGWVRVVNSAVPTRSVRLMRGGRVLGYLTCNNDRYDFGIFDGVEVGVVGPKEATADGTWLLDVQRLDVLGVLRR